MAFLVRPVACPDFPIYRKMLLCPGDLCYADCVQLFSGFEHKERPSVAVSAAGGLFVWTDIPLDAIFHREEMDELHGSVHIQDLLWNVLFQ